MIKKQSPEEQLATMQRLIKFGVNENTSKSSAPVVEFKKKAANGKTYGIVHESAKFYIMEAPQKDTEVLAEDFDYIGGFNNRKENEYSSYAKASNALDLKLMSINESVEKQNRVVIETPKPKTEWQTSMTEGMRKEIDRFKTITANVATILSEENKSHGTIPSEHTVPEAPSTHPSAKKVNSPFTDTAVANGDKDFKKEEHNHETAGWPFDTNGEVSSKDMQSDKKPSIKATSTYSENAQYVPNNSVADKNPSGGKVVRVNEGRNKIRLKLTENQVLAWNDSKNYMDASNGTEIGSSAPYDEEIKENESMICDDSDYKARTSEIGDTSPYNKKVNEDTVKAEDAAGVIDDEDELDDVPFPEVEDDDNDDFEEDDEFVIPVDGDNEDTEFEIDLDDKSLDNSRYDNRAMRGMDNWEKDWDNFDDFDDSFEESRAHRRNRISERRLNVFGKHPAYRKQPMTTPPNREVAINGAREWDDESAQGDLPFGEKIGSSTPYDNFASKVTESIVGRVFEKKKSISERKVLKVSNGSQEMPMEQMPPMGNDMGFAPNGMPPMGDVANNMPPMNTNSGMDMPNEYNTHFDPGVEADEESDPKKFIQQLTGKLSQSLKNYIESNEQPDVDLSKYVVGMIAKQAMKGLSPDDAEEITKKIKADEDFSVDNNNGNNMPQNDMNNDINFPNEGVSQGQAFSSNECISRKRKGKLDEIVNGVLDKKEENIYQQTPKKDRNSFKKKPFTSPNFEG